MKIIEKIQRIFTSRNTSSSFSSFLSSLLTVWPFFWSPPNFDRIFQQPTTWLASLHAWGRSRARRPWSGVDQPSRTGTWTNGVDGASWLIWVLWFCRPWHTFHIQKTQELKNTCRHHSWISIPIRGLASSFQPIQSCLIKNTQDRSDEFQPIDPDYPITHTTSQRLLLETMGLPKTYAVKKRYN